MDHYEKFHCHCHLQCPTSSQKVGQNNLFGITMGLCKKIDFRRLMLWPRFNEYIHILSISYLLFVSRMRNWHKLDFDIRHQSFLSWFLNQYFRFLQLRLNYQKTGIWEKFTLCQSFELQNILHCFLYHIKIVFVFV